MLVCWVSSNLWIAGWSHHPVSKSRYHFIIPGPEQTERSKRGTGPLAGAKICLNCKEPLPAGYLAGCPSCAEKTVTGRFLDSQGHLLHGVIHCNGYGHLLRINGREKGSKFSSGRDMMDLWDRMCAMLRARYIMFIFRKYNLQLCLDNNFTMIGESRHRSKVSAWR